MARFPINNNDRLFDWATLIRLWRRMWLIQTVEAPPNPPLWPGGNNIFAWGTFDSLSSTSLKAYAIDLTTAWVDDDWNSSLSRHNFPSNFDLFIGITADHANPQQRARIRRIPIVSTAAGVDGDYSGTLGFADQHFDSADLSYYASSPGNTFIIVKRGGFSWHQNSPPHPNPRLLDPPVDDDGTMKIWPDSYYHSGVATAVTSGSISDSKKNTLWSNKQFDGMRIAFKDHGNARIGTITHTLAAVAGTDDDHPGTDATIQFSAAGGHVPDGDTEYAICPAGSTYWTFGTENYDNNGLHTGWPYFNPTWWYSGEQDVHYSFHNIANLFFATTGPARATITRNFDGEDTDIAMKDNDPYTQLDSDDFPDTRWQLEDGNVSINQTLRQLQVDLINASASWIPPRNYSDIGGDGGNGYGIASIHEFTPAEFYNFNTIGISGTSSVGVFYDTHGDPMDPNVDTTQDESWNAYSAVDFGTPPYTPITIFWTVIKSTDGSENNGGTTTWNTTDDNKIIVLGANDAPDHDVGWEVIWAYGYTRTLNYEVAHLWEHKSFQPDVDPDTMHIYDPPEADNPGSWSVTSPSSNYSEHDDDGNLAEEGEDISTHPHTARYRGDNFKDCTTSSTPTGGDGGQPPLSDQYDNFGTHEYVSQAEVNSQHFGDYIRSSADDGGAGWLFDDSANFDVHGQMDAITLTCTAGSSTSFTDSSKSGDGRFDPANGYGEGFVLEATDGANSGIAMPISLVATTGVVTIDSAYPFPHAFSIGDHAKIVLPRYQTNPLKGRKITITRSGGAKQTAYVTMSSNKRLYFSTEITVAAGDSYEVQNWRTGAVLYPSVVDGTLRWDLPAGVPYSRIRSTLKDALQPDEKVRYGYYRAGDKPNKTVLNEIYRGELSLRMKKKDFGFISQGENNEAFGRFDHADDGVHPYSDALDEARTGIFPPATTPSSFQYYLNPDYNPFNEDTEPFASVQYTGHDQPTSILRRAYAYPTISGIGVGNLLNPYSPSIDFFLYVDIEEASDASHVVRFDDNGDGVRNHQWTSILSATPDPDGTFTSATAIGNTSLPAPNYGPSPGLDAGGTYDKAQFNGWAVTAKLAIVDYTAAFGDF